MKILQLGKFYPVRGGVEKVMYDLTSGLSARGIHCDMLCATREIDPGEVRLNDCGRVICVRALAKLAGTMIAPAMISWLRAHKDEYDIIHVHHPDPMAALALRLSGYKGRVILHWHSDIVSQKQFYLLYLPLQNWLIRRAERVVGTTPVYVKNSPHLKKAQDKCTFLPIGILPVPDASDKAAAVRAHYPGSRLLLSIGRLVPYKGYEYLIDAMQCLPADYHLVIGGEGPLRKKLEERIKDAGLEDRVSLLGYLPDEVMPAMYAACDVFVLSSVMKTEAFGIVQIEAMSCGKPVVATNIPASGVSWVNADGISGINVEPRIPAALAIGIEQAYWLKDKLGRGARALYQERYTLDAMIDKAIKIYEKEV